MARSIRRAQRIASPTFATNQTPDILFNEDTARSEMSALEALIDQGFSLERLLRQLVDRETHGGKKRTLEAILGQYHTANRNAAALYYSIEGA